MKKPRGITGPQGQVIRNMMQGKDQKIAELEADIERLKTTIKAVKVVDNAEAGVKISALTLQHETMRNALNHYADGCMCPDDDLEHLPDCEARIAVDAISITKSYAPLVDAYEGCDKSLKQILEASKDTRISLPKQLIVAFLNGEATRSTLKQAKEGV